MAAGPAGDGYHHADLRRALLDAAVEMLAAVGPAALSQRELARRVGASHAAPAHHFVDKTGLLTAVAVDGFARLDDALSAAWHTEGAMLAVGVAYVRFATEHRGHFAVMFQPQLLHNDDPALIAARASAREALLRAAGQVRSRDRDDADRAAIAGWSLMHGLATLWLDGNLRETGDDPVALAGELGEYLFQASKG